MTAAMPDEHPTWNVIVAEGLSQTTFCQALHRTAAMFPAQPVRPCEIATFFLPLSSSVTDQHQDQTPAAYTPCTLLRRTVYPGHDDFATTITVQLASLAISHPVDTASHQITLLAHRTQSPSEDAAFKTPVHITPFHVHHEQAILFIYTPSQAEPGEKIVYTFAKHWEGASHAASEARTREASPTYVVRIASTSDAYTARMEEHGRGYIAASLRMKLRDILLAA